MSTSYLEQLQTFTEDTLPDLDVVVLGALELFQSVSLPSVETGTLTRPLVIGSVNGEATGRLLFEDTDAIFANESTYKQRVEQFGGQIDGAVLISASGSKHAIEIAAYLTARNIKTYLCTNNQAAPAREHIDESRFYVFPKNREPYTYNTSTYMGMLLARTGENAGLIRDFIEREVAPRIPTQFSKYSAFCLMVPTSADSMRPMFYTKFDELFGPRAVGRVFTHEQMKHAKTVIPSIDELFISFGKENDLFGSPENRLTIPLPEPLGHVGMMAIGYYVIGHIQKQYPPYFKKHIAEYVARASNIFHQTLSVIVE